MSEEEQFHDNNAEQSHNDALETQSEPAGEEPTNEGASQQGTGGAAEAAQTTGGYQSRTIMTIVVIAVLLVAAGVGLWFYFGGASNGDSALSNGGGPIATVNGDEISQSEFDSRMDQVASAAGGNGNDISDEQRAQLEQRVADQLVQQKLLEQYAAENNISVSESDIDERYQEVVEQVGGEEQLQDRLSQQNMSGGDVRDSIEQQLLRDKIVDARATSSVEVSDEEVQSRYDQLTQQAQSGQVPPFEQLEEQLRSQLKQQKQQQIIQSLVQELRQDGNVEMNVN